MQPFERIREYSQAVCSRIKWKKAHPAVAEEIENHLVDQRNAYMAEGADEAVATDRAIVQMGDPVVVGVQLNRTHRPKPPWSMLAVMAVMMSIGLAYTLIFNASELSVRWILIDLAERATGLGLMAALYFLGFAWIGRRPVIVYVLLLAVFAAAFTTRQWISLWGYGFYMPLLFPIGFAGIVYSARDRGYRGIALCEIAFLLPLIILVWDGLAISQILFSVVTAIVILCAAVSRGWFKVKISKGYLLICIPVAMLLLLAAVVILSDGSKLERVLAAFNPSFADLDSNSWGARIKAALAGAKFIGQGVVPDPQIGDPGYGIFYILTSCIFYYGWISVAPVIGLLLYFIIKGFRLCMKQKNALALFLSISAMVTFTLQIANYILFNLGFDLFFPYSFLPFLTWWFPPEYYANSILAGIMLSVFRTGHVLKGRDTAPVSSHGLLVWNSAKPMTSLGKK